MRPTKCVIVCTQHQLTPTIAHIAADFSFTRTHAAGYQLLFLHASTCAPLQRHDHQLRNMEVLDRPGKATLAKAFKRAGTSLPQQLALL